MTMSTRSRLSLLLAIAALVVAGILGTRSVGASAPSAADGSVPSSGGVAGICVAPATPESEGEGPPPFAEDCNDTIDVPVVIDPDVCGEKVSGTGPDAAVSSTPCPGDEPPVVTDAYADAQLVEPRPGMTDSRPHGFDRAVVNDDGRSLTIFFWSGVEPCYVLDRVEVDAGPGAITVTLFEGHDANAGDIACIDIALLEKVIVTLDEPVGHRRIVDGAA
ncbi:MAG: hypothetical protein ACRDG8_09820 [Actinomycetota bacterium]